MGKKLVSMLLVLAIGLALLPGMAVQTYAEDGTTTTVPADAWDMSDWATATDNRAAYEAITSMALTINDAADFEAFQEALCTYGQTFVGYTIYLTADIDMNSDWNSTVSLTWDDEGTLTDAVQVATGVGDTEYALPLINTTSNTSKLKQFGGVFDGRGHSISGLCASVNSSTAISLFGQVVGKTAEVKNLAVLDSYFENPYAGKATSNVNPIGGLFSVVPSGTTVTISNCYVDIDLFDGKVPSTSATIGKVGGLVGYCAGTLTVKDCVYAGSASYRYVDGGMKKYHLGGAVGYASGATITMENYVFAGTLYSQFERVSGGIGCLSEASRVDMKNCMNLGKIRGSDAASGMIACILVDYAHTVTLTDCYTVTSGAAVRPALVKDTAYADDFSITITSNGTDLYTKKGSDAAVNNGVNPCKVYLKDDTWVFDSDVKSTLTQTAIGGDGSKLSDVFTIVGGVLAPKSLYENVLSKHIPTALTHRGFTLSLEGNIWMNKYAYFYDTNTDLSGINLNANAGLLTWYKEVTAETATYGTQDAKAAGLTWVPGKGAYGQSTEGIAAAEYGNKLYMREYVNVDGNYIYGELKDFSVKDYCMTVVGDNTDTYTNTMKNLSAAILHYGAAAQKYFVDDVADADLVNAELTGDYATLVDTYKADMIDSLVTLGEEGNTDEAPYTNIAHGSATNVAKSTNTLSLNEGIFINYYYYLNNTYDSDITAELLTWSGVEGELTEANATVTELTWLDEKQAYAASGALVAAPKWGNTIYACARFTDADGNATYTEIAPYSAHEYAKRVLEAGTYSEELENVCKALVVYSDWAEQYAATLG